ncbi:MAG: hypothetical protein GWO41_03285, partial [candidate division Zixibacteria bacterium]|nr:hypothetical protein [candidate division KSB1 bacterium]NIR63958.1 hypothetical protein [candidate division Zixibacteria bacterium]NIT51780.1 hypothetical protein [candidate division Zixibacteria bacterium]NIV06048.1 hypothetical protein [candidate division Zixibacteria bacterium]NIX56013.1 hypothetical protein [candidate division Zixibacteria bacterium]
MLDLRKNGITDEGALALAQSKNFIHLQSVDLTENQLTDKGKEAIAGFLILNLIRHRLTEDGEVLDLSKLNLGDVQAKIIADFEGLSQLKKLYLELNHLTAKGIACLA